MRLQAQEACLCIDFGNNSSKLSLAYINDRGRKILVRVPFSGPREHPEHPGHAGDIHQFVAFAGVDQTNHLVIGRPALALDLNIPLKTILTYFAGITRTTTIKGLPGGKALKNSVSRGIITEFMMQDALIRHFKFLLNLAESQARAQKVVIKAVVLTYPNFLCFNEESGDFDKYTNKYISLVCSLLGDDMIIATLSEGQAAALYVCEDCEDSWGATDRENRNRLLFGDLNKSKGLNLLVVDGGASTLNLQNMSIYFDNVGEVAHGMSNVPHGCVTGTLGGSNLANDKIRRIVEDNFNALVNQGQLQEGELAALMLEFDEKKKNLNYMTKDATITLRSTTNEYRSILLGSNELRDAFQSAFHPGTVILRDELKRLVKEARDCTVLFCGGSYCNPGLYSEVSRMLLDIEFDALVNHNITFKHTFLRDEVYWSSAVASGGALSMLRYPSPIELLDRSAIGIQKIVEDKDGWVGNNHAKLLLGSPGDPSYDVDISIPKQPKKSSKFYLVCDPTYLSKHSSDPGKCNLTKPPRIRIPPPGEEVRGKPGPYDLEFTISPEEIPKGKVRFSLRRANMNERIGDIWSITLQLSCCSIDKVTNSDMDKTWYLVLQTDPASKLLRVAKDGYLPLWCSSCEEEISQVAKACESCEKHNLCSDCYSQIDKNYASHSFIDVDMDTQVT